MYGRSGFKSFMFIDYQLLGRVKPLDHTDYAITSELVSIHSFDDATTVFSYDKSISPFDRSKLLNYYIRTAEFNFVSKINGVVNGYISCRKLDNCFALQPFYADNEMIAENLLLAVLKNVPKDAVVQWAVPATNKSAFYLLDKYFDIIKLSKNTNLGREQTLSLPLNKMFSMLDYMCSVC